MNGTVRFGTFSVFFGGTLIANGINTLDHNLWTGISVIVAGVITDVIGLNSVDKGVKEAIRLHDLEKAAAKANKVIR